MKFVISPKIRAKTHEAIINVKIFTKFIGNVNGVTLHIIHIKKPIK